MTEASLATLLLGRNVRLNVRPHDVPTDEGVIVTVYLDREGLHYVILAGGHLVDVPRGDQFFVLDEHDW
jgi:hypothetical protein